MEFTYDSYKRLILLLKEKKYKFSNFVDEKGKESERKVILRHDVDFDLERALTFAKLEKELGVSSTYFILLTSDFYNIFSKKSYSIMNEIINLGHTIGLHFDEKRYNIELILDISKYINFELGILKQLLNNDIKVVSMHRPSKFILENDLKIEGVINTYSNYYFKEYKYFSDSRFNWRENVIKGIESQEFDNLQILTHPFSYSEKQITEKEKLYLFINSKKIDTYYNVKDNFRDIDEFLTIEEIEKEE